jgi:peptide/nickel transport system permease protein
VSWAFRRMLQAFATFLVAVVLMFFLMRLAPGDPLSRLGDERPFSPAALATLRARYGLDQPLLTQFRAFVKPLARGDLGVSIQHPDRSVNSLIAQRLPATLLLGGTVLLINFTLGTWLGAWQAFRRGSKTDHLLTLFTLLLYATPSFWLGLSLVWLFGTEWHLLPVAFMHDPLLSSDAGRLSRLTDLLRHLILPAATLSLVTIAATVRYQRAAMLDVLHLVFIRTARTKGLQERQVRWHHAWRNAIGAVLALFGLWLPLLVAGSVFVESVFAWPGLGTLAAEAIVTRDYPVIMGSTILVSAVVVLGSLLADLTHRWLDPRLREG